jgi:NTP pyrophosphatase (non-canonical NTP hydrolase)
MTGATGEGAGPAMDGHGMTDHETDGHQADDHGMDDPATGGHKPGDHEMDDPATCGHRTGNHQTDDHGMDDPATGDHQTGNHQTDDHGKDDPATGERGGGDEASGMGLGAAQRAVDAYITQFAEGYWPPLTNLARLVEEVGELARELNHRYGHKTKKQDEPEQDLALELADILFVLIAIANEQKIDLEEAFHRVLEKYDVRDAGRWTRR